MFLIFDTETTTFPSKYLASTHPDQARIVQLACLLLDEKFNEVECYNKLFKLDKSVIISDGAYRQHKKSWDMCNQDGILPIVAMEKFQSLSLQAKLKVGHNTQFDRQLIDIEDEILTGATSIYKAWKPEEVVCTMTLMTPLCKLPHARRNAFNSSWKWPKLQEAHKFAFGEEFESAHDALADVRATARLFKWLIDNKHYNLCPNQPQQQQTTLT